MLKRAEVKRSIYDSLQEKHVWTVFVTYAVVSYVLSFRGNKGFLLDLKGTRENWERKDNKLFWLVLLGKLKGEHVDSVHFVPCAHTTSSGIKVNQVVKQLLDEKEKLGWIRGPAITNHQGQFYSSRELDGVMHEVLEEMFEEAKQLFPPDIKTKENLVENYHCFRSF